MPRRKDLVFPIIFGILEEKTTSVRFGLRALPWHQEVTWKFAVNKHLTHLFGFPVHILFSTYKSKVPILQLIIQKTTWLFSFPHRFLMEVASTDHWVNQAPLSCIWARGKCLVVLDERTMFHVTEIYLFLFIPNVGPVTSIFLCLYVLSNLMRVIQSRKESSAVCCFLLSPS